ncbi:hypothetical protein NZD89_29240 (plasmid) [Alicyclobacillus fastidiosus]|uniref:Reverse transcriptase Ty1/copia-type domain-containing protein n=1 Tax=Alicyclobacillus fastidiosus TaxID=392011 RepID=A0ABY6ZQB8_9BACL|nr:hypothetical protein NZD89_29240 [Alicyclobacillus fastidiosus]
MDDIIIIENDIAERRCLQETLAKKFEIMNLGRLKYFLEIEVAYSKEGIFLSLQKYLLDLFKEIGILGGNTTKKWIFCDDFFATVLKQPQNMFFTAVYPTFCNDFEKSPQN